MRARLISIRSPPRLRDGGSFAVIFVLLGTRAHDLAAFGTCRASTQARWGRPQVCGASAADRGARASQCPLPVPHAPSGPSQNGKFTAGLGLQAIAEHPRSARTLAALEQRGRGRIVSSYARQLPHQWRRGAMICD